MRNTILNTRIPTLLGIILITIGIMATSYLTTKGIIPFGQATPSSAPKQIRITDITDTSFTVSYKTEEQVAGSITYGKDSNFGNVVIDTRDQQAGNVLPRNIHYIKVANVQPNTKYLFAINSEDTTFLDTNNAPFQVTTAPIITTKPTQQQPIKGIISLPNNALPKEAVVYLTSNEFQTLSTLVKDDGTYTIPISDIRGRNLSSYQSFSSTTTITLFIMAPSYESTIKLLPNHINNIAPIILSNNYDFTIDNMAITLASQSASASEEAQLKFPSFESSPTSKNPKILSPQKDEEFIDTKPLFKGTASPGATIKVIIHSPETIQEQIKVDNKGTWTYRPQTSLSPGDHTISITAPDQFGILKTITQSFTVYASGSQVSESATPSATPRITSTPTPTTTIIPTPTLRPTLAPKITPIPTSIPPNETLLPTGNTTVMFIGLGGIIATISAILFLLLTRKRTLL